jgi:hypothetical protein
MVLTAYIALSPVSLALLPPSPAVCLRQLDTGVRVSGPHDFAVRLGLLVKRASASIASNHRVRDVRETPLCGVGRKGYSSDFQNCKAKYF